MKNSKTIKRVTLIYRYYSREIILFEKVKIQIYETW